MAYRSSFSLLARNVGSCLRPIVPKSEWIHLAVRRPIATADSADSVKLEHQCDRDRDNKESGTFIEMPLPPSLAGSEEQPVRWTVAPVEDGSRLDRFIKRRAPGVPPGLIQKLIRQRKVQVNLNAANHNSFKVFEGDEIRFPGQVKLGLSRKSRKPPKDDVSLAEAQVARSWVLHRDARAAVINKPAGLPVSPAGPSSVNPKLLAKELNRPPGERIRVGEGNGPLGIDSSRCLQDLLCGLGSGRYWLVHQIDKEVSGAVVVARDVGAAGLLSEFFRSRLIRKTYWALVYGAIPKGSGSVQLPIDGKIAYTGYRVIERVDKTYTWLALYPRTGRKHQLRIHCAHGLGCPIVGDVKYSSDDDSYTESRNDEDMFEGLVPGGGLHLLSRQIEYPVLTIPSVGSRTKKAAPKRYIAVSAPLPPHMRDTWKRLGLLESLGTIDHPDKPK